MSVSIGVPGALPAEIARQSYDEELKAVLASPDGTWVPFECGSTYRRRILEASLRIRCKKQGIKIQSRSDGQKRLWVRRIEKQKRKDME